MDAPQDVQNFSYLHAEHNSWSHREPLTLHHLEGLNADVICLQEVNRVESISRAFKSTHSLLYAPKMECGSSFSLPQGCAMLVKRSRLEVCTVETLYFTTTGLEDAPLSNQNAILTLLRDKTCGRYFVVACTHLKSGRKPENELLREAQVRQLVAALRSLRVRGEMRNGTPGSLVPSFLMGDLNTYPGDKPYYSLLATWGGSLHSAYNPLLRSGLTIQEYSAGEPAFTTWKFRGGGGTAAGGGISEKKATEDYIFMEEGCGMERRAVLRLPRVEDIGQLGLPSVSFPSDHVILGLHCAWSV